MEISQGLIKYLKEHEEETKELLYQLAKIPAPSNHEEKRVDFCQKWLRENGVSNFYVDEALNIICPFGDVSSENPLTVFMAHSDVVFPDTEELPLRVEDGKAFCPGIGDDTIHAVNILLAVRYLTQNHLTPKNGGMLLVINSGEEGLGNLKGSKRICEKYGAQISEFYTFDACNGHNSDVAVGSMRYRVEVKTEGGHSYNAFGNRNAIVYLASLIETLYQIKVPEGGKTTFNVGTISGGTSVNTIAQNAEMLYEFRSDRKENLHYMESHFNAAIEYYRKKGIVVVVELVGMRPCGEGVDPIKEQILKDKVAAVIKKYCGVEPVFVPGSTDCNIPMSMGIPSINTGCYIGRGNHTREEYIEISSIIPNQEVAFDLILGYVE